MYVLSFKEFDFLTVSPKYRVKINTCESFHSHFNESFHSSHPSPYVFVEILLGVQIDNYIKINSVEIRHKSNATTLKKQKTIDMFLNLYKFNSITRIQFIQNVCHNFEK
jgi:hypothetical protein